MVMLQVIIELSFNVQPRQSTVNISNALNGVVHTYMMLKCCQILVLFLGYYI